MIYSSVQHVLLLKPNQYSKSMLDTFGSTLLEDLHKAQVQCWVEDCQGFKNHEVEVIQDIIDVSYIVAQRYLCTLLYSTL